MPKTTMKTAKRIYRYYVQGLLNCQTPIDSRIKQSLLCWGFVGLLFCSGCTTPGRYVLSVTPTESMRGFKNFSVANVAVGTVEDQVDQTTLGELRNKLVEEIGKKQIYQSVGLEANGAPVLEIQPKIIAFHKGSQTARYFLGAMADESAKAHMDVECKFIKKETGQTIAQGVFTGEITGGLFGGSANQSTLSTYVAQHVASFLAKEFRAPIANGHASVVQHSGL